VKLADYFGRPTKPLWANLFEHLAFAALCPVHIIDALLVLLIQPFGWQPDNLAVPCEEWVFQVCQRARLKYEAKEARP
jgi:hypothetical protein